MEDSTPSPEELERRTKWFSRYVEALENRSVVEPENDGYLYRCPCCGFRTLKERGGYNICPVCFWEDDGQDDPDAGIVRGGPNGSLSLAQARMNFKEFGACDQKSVANVRPPNADEML
jgi:hypothetical protein